MLIWIHFVDGILNIDEIQIDFFEGKILIVDKVWKVVEVQLKLKFN